MNLANREEWGRERGKKNLTCVPYSVDEVFSQKSKKT
jgi:hypothetical protein